MHASEASTFPKRGNNLMAKTPLYKGTPYPKPPCEFYVCSPLKINKSIFQEIAGANSQGSSLKPRGKGRGKEDTAVRGPAGCNLLPGLGPPAPLKAQAQCSHVPVPKLPASSSSATHTPLPSLTVAGGTEAIRISPPFAFCQSPSADPTTQTHCRSVHLRTARSNCPSDF